VPDTDEPTEKPGIPNKKGQSRIAILKKTLHQLQKAIFGLRSIKETDAPQIQPQAHPRRQLDIQVLLEISKGNDISKSNPPPTSSNTEKEMQLCEDAAILIEWIRDINNTRLHGDPKPPTSNKNVWDPPTGPKKPKV